LQKSFYCITFGENDFTKSYKTMSDSIKSDCINEPSGERRDEDRDEIRSQFSSQLINQLRDEAETPSSKDVIRDVCVKQLNYGYIVTIGCHKFAIETPEKLIEKLGEYIKSPQETESKWFKGQLF